MSYTIEYARQFLVSKEGITPTWLCGSNNCTQVNRLTGREVRERGWNLWYNLLGVSEAELIAKAEGCANSYDCHWMSHGKFLTNEDVVRWVKNGIKRAYPIEEVLAENGLSSISCYVSVWRKDTWGVRELEASISTTEELDQWIVKVRSLLQEEGKAGSSAYPVFEFPEYGFRPVRPNPAMLHPEKTWFMKYRGGYICELDENHLVSSADIEEAIRFDSETAIRLMSTDERLIRRRPTLVDADAVSQKPRNAVIKVGYDGYITRVTKSGFYQCHNIAFAKRYADLAASQAAVDRLQSRFAKHYHFEAITVDAEDG